MYTNDYESSSTCNCETESNTMIIWMPQSEETRGGRGCQVLPEEQIRRVFFKDNFAWSILELSSNTHCVKQLNPLIMNYFMMPFSNLFHTT